MIERSRRTLGRPVFTWFRDTSGRVWNGRVWSGRVWSGRVWVGGCGVGGCEWEGVSGRVWSGRVWSQRHIYRTSRQTHLKDPPSSRTLVTQGSPHLTDTHSSWTHLTQGHPFTQTSQNVGCGTWSNLRRTLFCGVSDPTESDSLEVSDFYVVSNPAKSDSEGPNTPEALPTIIPYLLFTIRRPEKSILSRRLLHEGGFLTPTWHRTMKDIVKLSWPGGSSQFFGLSSGIVSIQGGWREHDHEEDEESDHVCGWNRNEKFCRVKGKDGGGGGLRVTQRCKRQLKEHQ